MNNKNHRCFFCNRDLGYFVTQIEAEGKKTSPEVVAKTFLICQKCLMGEAPLEEKYFEALRLVWKSGVIVRQVPEVNENFLRVLKQMMESGEIILTFRDCSEHKRREMILGDKEKNYCLEWGSEDLVKYSSNEAIREEIKKRKKLGFWIDYRDNEENKK